MASDTLWEREEVPAYRKKICSLLLEGQAGPFHYPQSADDGLDARFLKRGSRGSKDALAMHVETKVKVGIALVCTNSSGKNCSRYVVDVSEASWAFGPPRM